MAGWSRKRKADGEKGGLGESLHAPWTVEKGKGGGNGERQSETLASVKPTYLIKICERGGGVEEE